jgi:predicted phage terminase large subunit-like protein
MDEKKEIGSYLFNAIYQGEPQERDGNIFKREWFMNPETHEIYNQLDEIPAEYPRMRYWDFGASGKKGDATAGALTAYDGNNFYILDINTGKYSAGQVLSTFQRTAIRDGVDTKIRIEQEPGAGSKLLINAFRRDKELKRYHIRSDKVRMAKNIRSFDLEALSEDGKVYFVKADWNNKLIDQLVSFTGADGGEDDIVDTATGSAKHWMRPRRKINV